MQSFLCAPRSEMPLPYEYHVRISEHFTLAMQAFHLRKQISRTEGAFHCAKRSAPPLPDTAEHHIVLTIARLEKHLDIVMKKCYNL